jgi:O-antigen/teichoic acid export membrane protein
MWYPIHSINLNVLQVKGRSDLFFRVEILKKVIGISILLITMQISVIAMAIGTICSSLIALVINTYYTKKLLNYGLIQQFKDLFNIFAISVLSCIPAFAISLMFSSTILHLAISVILSIVMYIAISKIFKIVEFLELIDIVKNKLSKG